jgi:hypothetical protein
VGTIGAALVTHNNQVIVQIEMVGFSKKTPWLPDDETTAALASLMAACNDEYGIPLDHPWADGDFGKAGDNPHRSSVSLVTSQAGMAMETVRAPTRIGIPVILNGATFSLWLSK